MEWVAIQGDFFQMGTISIYADEAPVHSVTVPSFEMAKTETTVEQYQACVDDGVCADPAVGGTCRWQVPGLESHALNCVSWSKADTFCTWARGRLPTEAEWEFAARGGGLVQEFPWGDDPATCSFAVMSGCGPEGPMPVCSIAAGNTAQGLCDMAGNVWEWVDDWYHSTYTDAPDDGSSWGFAGSDGTKVIRGGCWANPIVNMRVFERHGNGEDWENGYKGFRCARSAPN